ncbi:MAG: 6-bladed beta-propeller [bacterium]|nr:6-bladed beta-propeller [bacterium]
MNKLLIFLTIILIPGLTLSEGYDPKHGRVDEYLKQAFSLYNCAEFDEAICLYKKALDIKPDHSQTWYWLGRSYYRTGQMEQFFSAWDRFIRLSKEDTSEIKRKMKMYLEIPVSSNIYESLDTIEANKIEEATFYNPAGIAIDSADNLYLCSFGSNAILKFSSLGNYLLQFPGFKPVPGLKPVGQKETLSKPYSIALDMEDNIYVTDSGNNQVQKFDSNGNFLMKFGQEGKNKGEFISPKGIALDKEAKIYVVDSGNSRIQIFSKEGKFIGKIGEMGKGKDKLLNPIGIALDEKKGIWIIEQGGKYLKKFAGSGNFQNSFALPQEGLTPGGIIYGGDGKLYIAFLQGLIFKFNIETEIWEGLTVGSKLSSPCGLAMNKYGLLYVTNFDKNSISIFMPDGFKKTQFDALVKSIDTSHYPTITMPVLITTQNKAPLNCLTVNNFKVEEMNRWMRPITISAPLLDNEYCVTTFIIDTSKKMTKYKNDVQRLLNKFINDLNGGVSAVSLIGFDENIEQIQPITRNKTALRNSIERLAFDKHKDKDTIFSAIRLGIDNMTNLICRKAICLIVCGDEIEEGTLFKECSFYAKNNHIPLFVIDYRLQNQTNSLKNLAELSLGDYYLAYKSVEAQKLYKTIVQETKKQHVYLISYQTSQEQWAGEWVDVSVSAGHEHLYARDKINYIVPAGKGMDKKIIEKIEQRIKKKELEEIAKEKEEGKEAHKKAEGHGGGGGHGGAAKPEGFSKLPKGEEAIDLEMNEPIKEKFISDDAAAKPAGGHGGGH